MHAAVNAECLYPTVACKFVIKFVTKLFFVKLVASLLILNNNGQGRGDAPLLSANVSPLYLVVPSKWFSFGVR